MAGRSVNNSSNANAAVTNNVATATDPLNLHPPIEKSGGIITASLPEIAAINKTLNPELREKLEQQVKLRYVAGSLSGIYRRLEMAREEEGVDAKLDQEIANVVNKKEKLRSLIDSNWEVIKRDLSTSGKTESEINNIQRLLQNIETKSLGDFNEHQKQHQEAQHAAQLKELNNRSWYQRIADPIYRVIHQSPELVRQQVGILYGGYRELALGIYNSLKEGNGIKAAWHQGVERSGNYIENYRKQCEKEKTTNGIGSVLGNTTEFSKGNFISDLITLHPITAYANPVMEVVDAIYDEALLNTTNTLTNYMGGEETLSYIELKKLQASDFYFKAGKVSLDVAKIAGALTLSPQIAAQQGIFSQAKIAGNVVKSNFLFSGVISTGQELKSLSMPSTEGEQKKFSLFQTLTNISGNTLTNTANSIGMSGAVDAMGKGYLGLNKLRLPHSKLNPLSTQLTQGKAMAKFQLGNSLYQTVDDLNDFLDSAKDSSQNLDWSNPLNILGHALVLGATTKDLMGNGPNDRSPFKEELITKANQAILDYGDTLTLEQFDNLLEQKHAVEADAFAVDENTATYIDLNGREVKAHYSFNKEVLYFATQADVVEYRNKRAAELSSGTESEEIDSKGTKAFYDRKQNIIVAVSPLNITSERDLIIHRSFLVHEIAHKRGLMSESLAYIAQAQYLLEYGYQMVFKEDGREFEILKVPAGADSSSLLPEIEDIQYFVSQKENIYSSKQRADSINTLLAASVSEDRDGNEKRFFQDLETTDLETVVKNRADYSLSLKGIALLLAREEKVIVWSFLKSYGLDNYDDYHDVALACAKFNIKQFFVNIKSFKFDRERVYELAKECLIIDPQVTLKKLPLLTQLNEAEVFKLATECCNLYPIKFAENVIEIIDQFNPSQRRMLALQCAENDPAATARKIKDFKLAYQDNILYVAQRCASLAGKTTMQHLDKFGITDSEDEFLVLLMCLRQDPVGAFHQLKRLDQFTQEQLIELATEAMLANPSGSLALLDRFDIKIIDQFGTFSTQSKQIFWKPLLRKAIFSKDLPRALEILGIFKNHNRLYETKEMLNKDKLALFEELREFTLAEYELSEDEVATLKYISEIIINWRIIPSGAMEALVSLTSEELTPEINLKIRNYISGLCTNFGSTFGDSVCQELSKLFHGNKDFHILQRIAIHGEATSYDKIVNDFLNTGFRGFSVATYEAFRTAYMQDKNSALRLIREWQEWSRKIAKGEELPAKIKNSPLYPSFVTTAYRPVEMSVARVHSLLDSVPDRTEHLSDLLIPNLETIELFDQDSISIAEGRTFDKAKVRDVEGQVLDAVSFQYMEGIDTRTIVYEAIRTGSLDRSKLIALFYKLEISPIREKVDELLVLREKGNDLETSSQIFYNLNKRLVLLSEILYLCSSTQLIKVLEDNLHLNKIEFENSLRSYVEKKPGFRHCLDKPELFSKLFRSHVLHLLETAFDKDANVIKKERKKLRTVASRELQSIQGTITKTTESFFARASAGLCTAEDMYSWNNKDFLQINIVDTNNFLVVGNVQMLRHFDQQSGQTYLIIRINPSSEFLKGTDPERLTAAMISMAVKVAELNNYVPCLPENDENLVLSNRTELIPILQAKFGQKISLNPKARIANKMFIETIYLLREITEKIDLARIINITQEIENSPNTEAIERLREEVLSYEEKYPEKESPRLHFTKIGKDWLNYLLYLQECDIEHNTKFVKYWIRAYTYARSDFNFNEDSALFYGNHLYHETAENNQHICLAQALGENILISLIPRPESNSDPFHAACRLTDIAMSTTNSVASGVLEVGSIYNLKVIEHKQKNSAVVFELQGALSLRVEAARLRVFELRALKFAIDRIKERSNQLKITENQKLIQTMINRIDDYLIKAMHILQTNDKAVDKDEIIKRFLEARKQLKDLKDVAFGNKERVAGVLKKKELGDVFSLESTIDYMIISISSSVGNYLFPSSERFKNFDFRNLSEIANAYIPWHNSYTRSCAIANKYIAREEEILLRSYFSHGKLEAIEIDRRYFVRRDKEERSDLLRSDNGYTLDGNFKRRAKLLIRIAEEYGYYPSNLIEDTGDTITFSAITGSSQHVIRFTKEQPTTQDPQTDTTIKEPFPGFEKMREEINQGIISGKVGCVFGKGAATTGKIYYAPVIKDKEMVSVKEGLQYFIDHPNFEILYFIPEDNSVDFEASRDVAWKIYLNIVRRSYEHIKAESGAFQDLDQTFFSSLVLEGIPLRVIDKLMKIAPAYKELLCSYIHGDNLMGLDPVIYNRKLKTLDELAIFALGPCYQSIQAGIPHPRWAPHMGVFCGRQSDIETAMLQRQALTEQAGRWASDAIGYQYLQALHPPLVPIKRSPDLPTSLRNDLLAMLMLICEDEELAQVLEMFKVFKELLAENDS